MSLLTRSRTESCEEPQDTAAVTPAPQDPGADGGLDSFHSTEDLKCSVAALYCLDVHLKVVIPVKYSRSI